MRKVEILIIGGGVAGTTAAETYRAGGGQGETVIVSDEPHRLYSRVLLPNAVKGKILPERVFLRDEGFYKEKGIDLLARRSVTSVDPRRRVAHLDDGSEIGFAKLVIAVGGKPRAWEVPGADLPGIHRLQTVEDARGAAETFASGQRLVIVGSGFIALEFAAIAVEKGVKAVILNRGPHFWASALGEPMGAAVEGLLKTLGVETRHGAKAEAALGGARVEGVKLSTGDVVACDAVGVGIGTVVPMEAFGDMKGEHGIRADASLETLHEGIWAAGDCAEFEDGTVGGLRHIVGNWTNAVAQGRHVGQALLGKRGPFAVLTSYSTAAVPGMNLIFMGANRHPGLERVTRVIEPGRKLLQFDLFEGQAVGAALLNAPDQRAAVSALILAGKPLSGLEDKLSDPTVPLDAFR